MSTPNFIRFASCFLLLFVTSCASTSSKSTDSNPRFREAASTDVVLEYYSWKTIYLTRPDSHVDGFYPILTRENVAAAINQHNPGHDLAVVILGWMIDPATQASVIHEWETILGDCGFHRVAFLRAGRSKQIVGLPVIQVSVIASPHAEPKAIASLAALSSAP